MYFKNKSAGTGFRAQMLPDTPKESIPVNSIA